MSDLPRLPFEPETEKIALRRFRGAVAEVIDVNAVGSGYITPPSKLRKHVFDFSDQMRMIASLDREGEMTLVHLSFSSQKEVKSQKQYRDFWERMHKRVSRITGKETEPVHVQVTSGAIHLYFKPEDFRKYLPAEEGEQKTVCE